MEEASNPERTLLDRIRRWYKIPGWIDLQVNGHAGISFSSPELTVDQVAEATEKLVSEGVYQFLPTVITSPLGTLEHCLSVLGNACEHPDLKDHLPGIHLEGPFLSPEPGARGAHASEHMEVPSLERFQQFQEAARGHIRILTLAPELFGACELIESISDSVLCSGGHSLASYEELSNAISSGLRMWTHLGNGLPVSVHRHDNPVIHVLARREITPSLIADGFHIPESLIRAAFNAKGVDGCLIVSDQSPFTGLPPGEYEFGDTPVVLQPDGFLRMRDEPYLAGSSRTLTECMEHLDGLDFLDDDALFFLGYDNPRRILGFVSDE